MAFDSIRNRRKGGYNADIPAPPAYRWPRSDTDLMRLANNNIISRSSCAIRVREQPKVVHSVSCRQMFLRSYTFSRKENFREKTKKRFGKMVRVGGIFRQRTNKWQSPKRKTSCLVVVRRVKEASCVALLSMFRRFLFCSPKVDVLAHHNGDLS